MRYYVYMLINKYKNKIYSYVGYTKDINKRIKQHNNSIGAKFTRGRKWLICYKETHMTKSKAMSREYKLKKDIKFRKLLKERFIKKNYMI